MVLTMSFDYEFDDEFTVHFFSSASMQIFGSNILASFRNFFNDEIQLSGVWRVAPSEMKYRLKGYENVQKISSDANVISRCYNAKKNVHHDWQY